MARQLESTWAKAGSGLDGSCVAHVWLGGTYTCGFHIQRRFEKGHTRLAQTGRLGLDSLARSSLKRDSFDRRRLTERGNE